jgi:IS30 family transposase
MLSKKQKKCLELMAVSDLSQREIAKQIDVAEETISRWKRNSEFASELDALIRISIRSLAAKAFRTHTNLLNAKSEMVRYMVAKDILDRAGFKPDDKIKFEGAIPVVIHDDLDDEDD